MTQEFQRWMSCLLIYKRTKDYHQLSLSYKDSPYSPRSTRLKQYWRWETPRSKMTQSLETLLSNLQIQSCHSLSVQLRVPRGRWEGSRSGRMGKRMDSIVLKSRVRHTTRTGRRSERRTRRKRKLLSPQVSSPPHRKEETSISTGTSLHKLDHRINTPTPLRASTSPSTIVGWIWLKSSRLKKLGRTSVLQLVICCQTFLILDCKYYCKIVLRG